MSMKTTKSEIITSLKPLFETLEQVEFAYLFGSAAKNKTSAISDLDIAVYLDEQSGALSDWRFRIDLIGKIMATLAINDIDLVYLNESPIVLKHEVIKHGILIDCKDVDKKFEFVHRTVKEYCDTNYLREFHLNAAKQRIKTGERRGSSPGFTKPLDSIRRLFDEAEGV